MPPLRELLGAPMDPPRFIRIAAALTDAVATAHTLGAPGNVRPDGVLIDEAGGTASLAGAHEPGGGQDPGGPREIPPKAFPYLAPEQIARLGRGADPRSDLYALGVIFYEMLTGTLPFEAENVLEWVHCHLARNPRPFSEGDADVPLPLRDIVMRLLAKAPEDRYQTAAALGRDLEHCRKALELGLELEPFPLGVDDMPNQERTHHRAQGGDAELAWLSPALGRARDDSAPGNAEDEARRVKEELERRLADTTAELRWANEELDAICYSVSHDLRAPLRAISKFSAALAEEHGHKLEPEAADYLAYVRSASARLSEMVDAMLRLSRVSRGELRRGRADLAEMARGVIESLRQAEPHREVDFVAPERAVVDGDARLLLIALENLLGNAWKFSGKRPRATIELGMTADPDGQRVYFVRDDGAGFDMRYADRLFTPYRRLHDAAEFAGTGIGLAIVQRIVRRHGGRIWAEAAVERGARSTSRSERARACKRFSRPRRSPILGPWRARAAGGAWRGCGRRVTRRAHRGARRTHGPEPCPEDRRRGGGRARRPPSKWPAPPGHPAGDAAP